MKNDLEVNGNSEFATTDETQDDTAELTNHDAPSSAGRQLMVIPPTAGQRKLRLGVIAKEIRAFEASNDETNVKVAFKIQEARNLFDKGAQGKQSWQNWVEKNLPIKISWANQLLQVANHHTPIAKLKEIRDQSKARTQKHRDKKKQTASPLRNGHPDEVPEPATTDSELEPERLELIKFATHGPLIDVIRILGEACPYWAVSKDAAAAPSSSDQKQVEPTADFRESFTNGSGEPANVEKHDPAEAS